MAGTVKGSVKDSVTVSIKGSVTEKKQTIPFPGPDRNIRIGDMIRDRRKQAGLSQQELADRLHIHKNTVMNWEADKSKPEYSAIPALCSVLGMKLHEFFLQEPDNGLSSLENHVVENLRLLSPGGRKLAARIISTMADEEMAAREAAIKEAYGLFLVRPGSVAAGVGAYVPDAAPTYAFLRKNDINERADGIVRVSGDSMKPVYLDGQFVYYRKAESARPGEDVIVDTDEGAVIKRVDADGTLRSVNPDPALAYPQKYEGDTLVIRGIVLGVVSSSDRAKSQDLGLLQELFAEEIREFNDEYDARGWDE
jgi:transcriptional regulator with XRE-family HTH domain